MADLDLSDPRLKASGFGGLGSGAFSPAGREGDVGDCFYNFTIPELASCSASQTSSAPTS
jgi:hypothetical protein